MPRGWPQPARRVGPEAGVHFFKRAEKAGEAVLEIPRPTSRLEKIAMAKLIAARDHRSAQGPVFMRSLNPGKTFPTIDPQGETHIGTRA
jgi:hypothetical protein